MKILIIGGSGIISSAVTQECMFKGYDLTIVNRGKRTKHRLSKVRYVVSDVRAEGLDEIRGKIGTERFDVVIDFLSYNLSQLLKTTKIVTCTQYIFISSCSIYEENRDHLYTEDSKKGNVGWEYCKNKYECECKLPEIAQERGFNYTIVRPYVTYSEKRFPYQFSPIEYYTLIYRIEYGLPLPITNKNAKTTVTNSLDFARGLVGLIGNSEAYNCDFHITSDHSVRWAEIADMMAFRYGRKCIFVEIQREFLGDYNNTVIDVPELLLDKTREMRFDNSKIKSAVPHFAANRTIEESIDDIYEEFQKTSGMKFNYIWTGCLDRLIYDTHKIKVNPNSYHYGSLCDRLMYMIGRYAAMCYLYNLARKIKAKIKKQ